MILHLREGAIIDQRAILRRLAELQYTRNEMELRRGTFRVRGDVVDIYPAESERGAVRVELFGDEIERLAVFDPLTGEVDERITRFTIYPKSHYVTDRETLIGAVDAIKIELRERLAQLRSADKLLEAQRLEQRTLYDVEMMHELGYCAGIENYSRFLSGRAPGEPPPTLIDYLPANALLVIDESHVTVPQLGGHVPRRPLTQGDPGGVRVPAAIRPRQPSPALRRVRGDDAPDHLRLRHPGPLRGEQEPPTSSIRWCARPAWWTRRSRCARWSPRWTI